MSSSPEQKKGEDREAVAAEAGGEWGWSSHQDPKQRVPPAITLHRLVPRPPPALQQATTTTTTTNTFKYIIPEEIKAAQIKARKEILASRLAPPAPPPSDSVQSKKHPHRKDGSASHPSFPCRLGSGEVGLRRRQLTRLMTQISRTLVELQELKDPRQRAFIAPLERETKRRRWDECARSMRRSLFVLRQEVVVLERASGPRVRSSQHLRALAAAARTLNTQLMTLKSQAESSCGDLAWAEVLGEFIGVARRMLALTAAVGIPSPPSSVKWTRSPQEGVTAAPEDGSGLDSAISTSQVDSSNIHLLQTGHVRDRLARLATLHLRKRKKQKSPKSRVARERRPSKQDIVLEPLKRQLGDRVNMSATPHSSATSSLLKRGDDGSSGVISAPKNTSLDHHSQPSQATCAGPQSQGSPLRRSPLAVPRSQPCESNHPAPEPHSNTVPEARLLPPNLIEQLSFMLERVCKIEDSRRRTKALIAEASHASHVQGVPASLEGAVQRARRALAAVRGTAPRPPLPIPSTRITADDSLPRNTGLSVKVPEGVLLRTSSGAGPHPWSEKAGQAAGPSEVRWLGGESVTEQVRRQKEQFWLSLAEQGFVRPPELVTFNGEEIHSAAQISSQSGSSKSSHQKKFEKSAEEKFARTVKETGIPIGHSPKTQSHQQTQTRLHAEHRQPLDRGGSSSDPSHDSPPAISKAQHSSSDSQIKVDVPSGNTKQSVSTESQRVQSVSALTTSGMPDTTDSQSFPSYEGVSSPA
ncbi:hypothetical protein GWK47_051453 [Chionoecetes opilio]|uniref:Uncharacterized protein n=1 Tax=Chionoecetes opilio TaxID=41210 RepID=A0A8J4Y9X3_CHIOP|nr:hypothetical protein GWK47_051453 [Chionoecetes opilio]